MPTAFYRCDKCGKEYGSHKGAKRCEASHLEPVSVKAIRYTIKPYPYSVEVVFGNGEKRIYNAADLGG
jgi:hypothetical protein